MFLLNLRGGLISTLTSYGSISQEFLLKVMMVNILLYLHMQCIMHSMAKSYTDTKLIHTAISTRESLCLKKGGLP